MLTTAVTAGLATVAYAEGSADLIRSGKGLRASLLSVDFATDLAPPADAQSTAIHYAYVREGETLLLGSSANGIGAGVIEVLKPDGLFFTCPTDVGLIANIDQELAGPIFDNGFQPCRFDVGPGDQGLWRVEFRAPQVGYRYQDYRASKALDSWVPQRADDFFVSAWDATVAVDGDAGLSPVPGRVFTPGFVGMVDNQTNGDKPWHATFFINTVEGYTYVLDTNGLDPMAFSFFSSTHGVVDAQALAQGEKIPEYLSIPTRGIGRNFTFENPLVPGNDGSTNRLYYNVPDDSMPVDAGWLGIGQSTWLNSVRPEVQYMVRGDNYQQADSVDLFLVGDEAPNHLVITLDLNGNGRQDENEPTQVVSNLALGSNLIALDVVKNYREEFGELERDTRVLVRFTSLQGRVHFPIADAEYHLKGFKLWRLWRDREPARLFWNPTEENLGPLGYRPDQIVTWERSVGNETVLNFWGTATGEQKINSAICRPEDGGCGDLAVDMTLLGFAGDDPKALIGAAIRDAKSPALISQVQVTVRNEGDIDVGGIEIGFATAVGVDIVSDQATLDEFAGRIRSLTPGQEETFVLDVALVDPDLESEVVEDARGRPSLVDRPRVFVQIIAADKIDIDSVPGNGSVATLDPNDMEDDEAAISVPRILAEAEILDVRREGNSAFATLSYRVENISPYTLNDVGIADQSRQLLGWDFIDYLGDPRLGQAHSAVDRAFDISDLPDGRVLSGITLTPNEVVEVLVDVRYQVADTSLFQPFQTPQDTAAPGGVLRQTTAVVSMAANDQDPVSVVAMKPVEVPEFDPFTDLSVDAVVLGIAKRSEVEALIPAGQVLDDLALPIVVAVNVANDSNYPVDQVVPGFQTSDGAHAFIPNEQFEAFLADVSSLKPVEIKTLQVIVAQTKAPDAGPRLASGPRLLTQIDGAGMADLDSVPQNATLDILAGRDLEDDESIAILPEVVIRSELDEIRMDNGEMIATLSYTVQNVGEVVLTDVGLSDQSAAMLSDEFLRYVGEPELGDAHNAFDRDFATNLDERGFAVSALSLSPGETAEVLYTIAFAPTTDPARLGETPETAAMLSVGLNDFAPVQFGLVDPIELLAFAMPTTIRAIDTLNGDMVAVVELGVQNNGPILFDQARLDQVRLSNEPGRLVGMRLLSSGEDLSDPSQLAQQAELAGQVGEIDLGAVPPSGQASQQLLVVYKTGPVPQLEAMAAVTFDLGERQKGEVFTRDYAPLSLPSYRLEITEPTYEQAPQGFVAAWHYRVVNDSNITLRNLTLGDGTAVNLGAALVSQNIPLAEMRRDTLGERVDATPGGLDVLFESLVSGDVYDIPMRVVYDAVESVEDAASIATRAPYRASADLTFQVAQDSNAPALAQTGGQQQLTAPMRTPAVESPLLDLQQSVSVGGYQQIGDQMQADITYGVKNLSDVALSQMSIFDTSEQMLAQDFLGYVDQVDVGPDNTAQVQGLDVTRPVGGRSMGGIALDGNELVQLRSKVSFFGTSQLPPPSGFDRQTQALLDFDIAGRLVGDDVAFKAVDLPGYRLEVTKPTFQTTDGGTQADWVYRIVNEGQVPLHNIVVMDSTRSQLGDVLKDLEVLTADSNHTVTMNDAGFSAQLNRLDPGMVYEIPVRLLYDAVANVDDASVLPDRAAFRAVAGLGFQVPMRTDGEMGEMDALSEPLVGPLVIQPLLDLQKSARVVGYEQAGELLTAVLEYQIQNVGQVAASALEIDDLSRAQLGQDFGAYSSRAKVGADNTANMLGLNSMDTNDGLLISGFALDPGGLAQVLTNVDFRAVDGVDESRFDRMTIATLSYAASGAEVGAPIAFDPTPLPAFATRVVLDDFDVAGGLNNAHARYELINEGQVAIDALAYESEAPGEISASDVADVALDLLVEANGGVSSKTWTADVQYGDTDNPKLSTQAVVTLPAAIPGQTTQYAIDFEDLPLPALTFDRENVDLTIRDGVATATIDYKVQNLGQLPLRDIQITDLSAQQLGERFGGYLSADAIQGGGGDVMPTINGDALTAQIDDLAPGQTVTVPVRFDYVAISDADTLEGFDALDDIVFGAQAQLAYRAPLGEARAIVADPATAMGQQVELAQPTQESDVDTGLPALVRGVELVQSRRTNLGTGVTLAYTFKNVGQVPFDNVEINDATALNLGSSFRAVSDREIENGVDAEDIDVEYGVVTVRQEPLEPGETRTTNVELVYNPTRTVVDWDNLISDGFLDTSNAKQTVIDLDDEQRASAEAGGVDGSIADRSAEIAGFVSQDEEILIDAEWTTDTTGEVIANLGDGIGEVPISFDFELLPLPAMVVEVVLSSAPDLASAPGTMPVRAEVIMRNIGNIPIDTLPIRGVIDEEIASVTKLSLSGSENVAEVSVKELEQNILAPIQEGFVVKVEQDVLQPNQEAILIFDAEIRPKPGVTIEDLGRLIEPGVKGQLAGGNRLSSVTFVRNAIEDLETFPETLFEDGLALRDARMVGVEVACFKGQGVFSGFVGYTLAASDFVVGAGLASPQSVKGSSQCMLAPAPKLIPDFVPMPQGLLVSLADEPAPLCINDSFEYTLVIENPLSSPFKNVSVRGRLADALVGSNIQLSQDGARSDIGQGAETFETQAFDIAPGEVVFVRVPAVVAQEPDGPLVVSIFELMTPYFDDPVTDPLVSSSRFWAGHLHGADPAHRVQLSPTQLRDVPGYDYATTPIVPAPGTARSSVGGQVLPLSRLLPTF